MSDQKITEKYVMLQIFQQNIEALKNQQDMIEKQFLETKSTLNALEEMKTIGNDNEVLIPLGSGCFAKGKITGRESLLTGIGAGVISDKKTADVKKILDERSEEIEKVMEEIQAQIEQMAEKMNEIGSEIQSMAGKQKMQEPNSNLSGL
ncbi:MAG: prefoldin subunit alpha [Candidatus Aenigmarchaeota archaeon]|nr:prefoldin subunit alpha [Candidatus Aenigmarchaeota archaeon]